MNKQHTGQPTFWRSRSGGALLVFLLMAGFLLALEHRAHIWEALPRLVILLPLLICIGMHFFMHGGHGGQGAHRNHDRRGKSGKDDDH